MHCLSCILLCVAGFLSTADSNAPGNCALLDQVAAMHWIKENIEAFGGDPALVTLLGQGYGGALVNLLLISPVTKGNITLSIPYVTLFNNMVNIITGLIWKGTIIRLNKYIECHLCLLL